MRIAILTTQTPHHSYFAQRLAEKFPVDAIVVEQEGVKAPFETAHPFENERDSYERELFFGGKYPELKTFAETLETKTINDTATIDFLKKVNADVAIVFGTRRIKPALIQLFPERMINLHGGDPEEYRGLDTHLWAVYHEDFGQLITTLHHLNENLDDGAIISRKLLQVSNPEMKLFQLRALNTEACVELTKNALSQFRSNGVFSATPQRRKGRYYSFMPTCLKELCVAKFENFVRSGR